MNRFIRYTNPRGTSFLPVLANRSLWSGLESEIDRLFASSLADYSAPAPAGQLPADLYEDQDNTYVRVELPGVNRDAISVEIVESYLNVSATRKDGEFSIDFSRSVSIPDSVQTDKVTAVYENGVLTVTLPKQEQAKPRKINVTVN